MVIPITRRGNKHHPAHTYKNNRTSAEQVACRFIYIPTRISFALSHVSAAVVSFQQSRFTIANSCTIVWYWDECLRTHFMATETRLHTNTLRWRCARMPFSTEYINKCGMYWVGICSLVIIFMSERTGAKILYSFCSQT